MEIASHSTEQVVTLLAPALSSLATQCHTTPLQLVDWLTNPELTDRLAAVIGALEAIEHIRALAARAPAVSACQSLLESPKPAEKRWAASALLRPPIHAPRRRQAVPAATPILNPQHATRAARESLPARGHVAAPPSPAHTLSPNAHGQAHLGHAGDASPPRMDAPGADAHRKPRQPVVASHASLHSNDDESARVPQHNRAHPSLTIPIEPQAIHPDLPLATALTGRRPSSAASLLAAAGSASRAPPRDAPDRTGRAA